MRKQELESELQHLRNSLTSIETRHEIELHEVSSFQRQLEREQKDGYWSTLDPSATKRNRSWIDVEKNLKDAYQAWCVNPFAKSYIDYQRCFVIGKGTQITTDEGDAETERLAMFCDLNDWAILEKSICEELSRDGEVFIRFHDRNINELEATVAAISLIDPLEITEIIGVDVNAPEAYRHVYRDDNLQTIDELLPAGEIQHIKVNCSHNEKRGRSDLLVVLPYLKQLKRWLDDMSRRNYQANGFIWDVECAGNISTSAVTAAYPNGPMPGSVIAHSADEKWSVNSPNMNWSDSTAGARAIKLLICAAFKLPESWFGDTGESNLATTKALAMPSLRVFLDRQDFLKHHFEKIITRGGRVERVSVAFPEIESEDAKIKADALLALSNAFTNFQQLGLLSRETAYKLLRGYIEELDEWDDDASGVGQKRKIEAEDAADLQAIAQGQKIGRRLEEQNG